MAGRMSAGNLSVLAHFKESYLNKLEKGTLVSKYTNQIFLLITFSSFYNFFLCFVGNSKNIQNVLHAIFGALVYVLASVNRIFCLLAHL